MPSYGPFVGGLVNPLNWPAWFKNKNGIISLSVNRVGHKGPVWEQTARPLLLYNSTPQFQIVVNRKAAMFSNMQIFVVDRKTRKRVTGGEADKFLAFLNKPNPTQSFNQWLKEHKQHESVFGSTYMYKNVVTKLSGVLPVALWNISPEYMRPVLTGKMYDQAKIEDIIQYYEYTDANTVQKRYEPAEIMYTRLTDLLNPVVGLSPVVGLNKPISNIKHAYDYRNVIMSEKGALGILSNKSKDGTGVVPLPKEEKQKLEEAYQRDFGIEEGQRRIHITNGSMSWEPMSYPTKDLLLFEEIDQDFETIINMLGLNINMFKNSTFDNVKNGEILAYQDTIQPEADQFCQALAYFGGLSPHLDLEASYEHVPILKEARLKHMQAMGTMATAFKAAVDAGFMSKEAAINMLSTEFGIPQ